MKYSFKAGNDSIGRELASGIQILARSARHRQESPPAAALIHRLTRDSERGRYLAGCKPTTGAFQQFALNRGATGHRFHKRIYRRKIDTQWGKVRQKRYATPPTSVGEESAAFSVSDDAAELTLSSIFTERFMNVVARTSRDWLTGSLSEGRAAVLFLVLMTSGTPGLPCLKYKLQDKDN
jgi:hypothetical protein